MDVATNAHQNGVQERLRCGNNNSSKPVVAVDWTIHKAPGLPRWSAETGRAALPQAAAEAAVPDAEIELLWVRGPNHPDRDHRYGSFQEGSSHLNTRRNG